MRLLGRNLTRIYYKNYLGKVQVRDNNGYFTGEYRAEYSSLLNTKCNISPSTGSVEDYPFGANVNYDKVAVFENPNIDISETSIMWVDEKDTSKPYDYIVVRVARSLNCCRVAIRKVDISNE